LLFEYLFAKPRLFWEELSSVEIQNLLFLPHHPSSFSKKTCPNFNHLVGTLRTLLCNPSYPALQGGKKNKKKRQRYSSKNRSKNTKEAKGNHYPEYSEVQT